MCQIFFYVRTINCRNKTIQSTIGILCLCVYNQNQNKNTIVIKKKKNPNNGQSNCRHTHNKSSYRDEFKVVC